MNLGFFIDKKSLGDNPQQDEHLCIQLGEQLDYMQLEKTGFILYVLNYEACVSFYEQTLGLRVLYRKETLTCFDFHGSYLMVEIDDETDQVEASIPTRDRTCIRLNVKDVKEACKVLNASSTPYTYGEYEWGTVAKFRDPDGNLIGFRSAEEHRLDTLMKEE